MAQCNSALPTRGGVRDQPSDSLSHPETRRHQHPLEGFDRRPGRRSDQALSGRALTRSCRRSLQRQSWRDPQRTQSLPGFSSGGWDESVDVIAVPPDCPKEHPSNPSYWSPNTSTVSQSRSSPESGESEGMVDNGESCGAARHLEVETRDIGRLVGEQELHH